MSKVRAIGNWLKAEARDLGPDNWGEIALGVGTVCAAVAFALSPSIRETVDEFVWDTVLGDSAVGVPATPGPTFEEYMYGAPDARVHQTELERDWRQNCTNLIPRALDPMCE